MTRQITIARPEPADLLAWYDRHHRSLPWRTPPEALRQGARPDPYRVWLSEIMLQQTTVAAVKSYFQRFTSLWPDVQALANAPVDDVLAEWAGLGYYARARNLHKCAVAVATDHGGVFPDTQDALQALPGIGAYTSAAIAAIAFDRPAVVVDGNVERVMARVHAVRDPMPGSKAELKRLAGTLTPEKRPGDYAQAVMDLGATICTPRNPACGICPWMNNCQGRHQGIAQSLPAKTPKAAKPIRRGTVWVALDPTGAVLTERRPDRGLLGGMLAFPTTDWQETAPDALPPFPAKWRRVGEVRHTFTHFHLILDVHTVRMRRQLEDGVPAEQALDAMPTVFAKAGRLALAPDDAS